MAQWIDDSEIKKTGAGRKSEVDWRRVFGGALEQFIGSGDTQKWLFLVSTPNRNNATYVRNKFPQWELATRQTDNGFDWYARPKKETK